LVRSSCRRLATLARDAQDANACKISSRSPTDLQPQSNRPLGAATNERNGDQPNANNRDPVACGAVAAAVEVTRPRGPLMISRAALLIVVLSLAGCGARDAVSGTSTSAVGSTPGSVFGHARPQVIEPTAGQQAQPVPSDAPVGDIRAHAPPLAEVKRELRLELIAARATSATYIDPLRYVTVWERTDQGVDASLPVGAPILAPSRVKVLATIPDWYAGQPLVYFELLDGPDAGRVQYVAEQITDIAPAGNIVQQGQAIARYAGSGTAIEYGWSTLNGVTLARATTGYEEGQVTPAGQSMRGWLNSLGANAGSG
jgi:hypothetical protein